MLVLYIIAGILLAFMIVLSFPVSAEVSYIDKKLDIKVKFLWLTLFPMKEKPPKKQKPPRKTKPQKAAKKAAMPAKAEVPPVGTPPPLSDADRELLEGSKPKKGRKRAKKLQKDSDFSEKLSMIKMVLLSSKKGLRRLLKGIRFDDIAVDFFVANEDACEAAIDYGKMNILVYNGISFLRTFFTISLEHINITCKYNSSDSVYDGSLKVKLTPRTAVAAGVSIVFRILVNIVKLKLQQQKQQRKETETQTTAV